MGVVHHSVWPVWLEAARVEWLRERGFSYREMEDSGVSLAVSDLQIRYLRAARFDDLLGVTARLEEARSRRFVFSYEVRRLDDGALLAEAQTRHVPTDRSGRAIRLPTEWLRSEVFRVGP